MTFGILTACMKLIVPPELPPPPDAFDAFSSSVSMPTSAGEFGR